MSLHIRRTTAILLAVLIGLTVRAAAPPQKPEVKVTTRLVNVSVVAYDKDGKPVTDLTEQDFSVTDQGQGQTISFFTRPGGDRPAERSEFAYSNRRGGNIGDATAGVSVILLDSLNTEITDIQYAREQLVQFLQQIQPGERVALYTLVHRLQVLHSLSEDSASLLRALKTYQAQYTTGVAKVEPPSETGIAPDPRMLVKVALDTLLDQINQKTADTATRDRVRRTAEAIILAAQSMSGLPGRKNLIWVSGGFPWQIGFDPGQMKMDDVREANIFYDEIEKVSRALNDANVALYPVDARGLLNPGGYVAAFSAATRGAPSQPEPIRGEVSRVPQIDTSFPRKNIETMNELAQRTGGLASYNTNELVGSVRRAADDSDHAYALGYYPTHNSWNGKFREIRVQVKRSGVKLRFRRGYFATAEQAVEQKNRDSLLREAAAAVFDATGLGVEANVESSGSGTARIRLGLDASELKLTKEGDRWVGALEFLFVARDSQGKALGGLRDGVNMRLTQATYDQVGRNGLRLTKDVAIPNGATEVRVVVLDPNGGRLGSLTVPLTPRKS
jgi:VWFA-related protein